MLNCCNHIRDKAMKESKQTQLRRKIGQRVRHMTHDQAIDWLHRYNVNFNTFKSIVSPPVQELTDGLNSQSINSYCVRRVHEHSRKVKAAA